MQIDLGGSSGVPAVPATAKVGKTQYKEKEEEKKYVLTMAALQATWTKSTIFHDTCSNSFQ